MRLAIVTGGSRGLGQALCRQHELAGFRVLEFSRSAPHHFSTQVDLAVPTEAPQTISAALACIDPGKCTELLVFNNAVALTPIGPVWRKATKEVLANLNANFTSAILALTAVMQHFRETACRKVIVNISSGAALKGYAGWSLYCASKAGMEGFIRGIAAEERHHEHPFIAISVDPGVIDTEMQAAIREASASDFPDVERFKRRKHQGGLASAEAVASGIIRLLSNQQLQPGDRYDAPTEA